jgi:formyl-CoA transferase
MSQALTGIRVIDMTHHQAGPSCTQMLAWLGAEVIKIEPPGTGDAWRHISTEGADGDSFFFLLLNTNKQSLTLDLKHPEAQAIFTTLLNQAEVFVENYGPGVMDRLGLAYEALRERHPRLIYASAKGCSVTGPYSTYKCFEEIAQATSGAMSATGWPEGPPNHHSRKPHTSSTMSHNSFSLPVPQEDSHDCSETGDRNL